MDELIFKHTAIVALWKALYEYEDKTEKQFQESKELDVADWFQHRNFVQNMSDIDRQTILNLPPVQPEPRWIPVTERLPELGEKVLVSTKHTVFTPVFKGIYGTPDRWGWEHNTIKKVTAWMPLPESYRGGEDE